MIQRFNVVLTCLSAAFLAGIYVESGSAVAAGGAVFASLIALITSRDT